MKAEGFDAAALAEAGLVKSPDDGGPPRDHFFNRIIFPIADRRGRVVGFGGRTLGDSKAKYINSPETPLFHKGSQLYNLDKAVKAAHDRHEVIVAEGYMDVIALAQEGFPAVVAPLGTAVTEEQIAALWRLEREPLFCLDGDTAGRRAALRAAERALPLLKPGYSLRFAFLPDGEDPDSMVKARGAQAFRDVLARSLPLVDILWHREADAREVSTPERRADLRRALREAVQPIRDSELREDYVDALLARFEARFPSPRRYRGPGAGGGYAGSGTAARSRGLGGPVRRGTGWERPASGAVILQRPDPDALLRRREQLLLALIVNHPALLPDVAEDLAGLHFREPTLESLRGALVDIAAQIDEEGAEIAAFLSDGNLDSAALKRQLGAEGFSGVVESLQSRKVLGHGSFARPEATEEAARAGFSLLFSKFRQDAAHDELHKAASDLARDLNEENLSRLQAKQRLGPSGEDALGADAEKTPGRGPRRP
jgi:DNA primase